MRASKETICVRSARDVIPNLAVLWSSGSTWHGIRADGCQFEDVKTPEFQTVDHQVLMHLSSPALVELKTNGQCDTRERITGDLSILPAASVCQLHTRDPHELLLVSVSRDLVAQTALEAGDGTPCEIIPRVPKWGGGKSLR